MKLLKVLLIGFLPLFFAQNAVAQIGFSGTYTSVNTDFEFDKDFPGFAPSYTFGVDYWFRLKNQRVEFYPQLSMLRSSKEEYASVNFGGETSGQQFNMYSLKLNTRVYPFDFNGDCNCPTWKKEGPTFNKGFYFLATFGGGMLDQIGFRNGEESESSAATAISYGVGMGLDFGLSKFLTISPFLTYERTTSTDWILHPCDICDQFPDNSILNPFSVGLHLQYRWKEY